MVIPLPRHDLRIAHGIMMIAVLASEFIASDVEPPNHFESLDTGLEGGDALDSRYLNR